MATGKADNLLLAKYRQLGKQSGIDIVKEVQDTYNQIQYQKDLSAAHRRMAWSVGKWLLVYPLIRGILTSFRGGGTGGR